jgi:hypothetical protein
MKKITIINILLLFSFSLIAQDFIPNLQLKALEKEFSNLSTSNTKGVIGVYHYQQCGQTWSGDQLGTCSASTTICTHGCALVSMTMLLKTNGVDVDPGELNTWLTNNGGYSDGCLLLWNVADDYPGNNNLQYIGSQTYSLATVKDLIDAGNPVILSTNSLITGGDHFVVIKGYNNNGTTASDFVVADPNYAAEQNLSDYETFGLRVFSNVLPVTQITEPYDGHPNVSLPVFIDWEEIPNADNYRIHIGTSLDGFTLENGIAEEYRVVNEVTGNISEYTWLEADEATTYYCAVKNNIPNIDGKAASYFCPAISFTTTISPPDLITPTANQTNVTIPVNFTWENINGADNNRIVIASDDVGFSQENTYGFLDENIVFNYETGTDAFYNWTGATENTTYYWTVRTNVPSKSTSEFASPQSFTTSNSTNIGYVLNFEIILYPNPAKNNVSIQIDSRDFNNIEIEITDYTGTLYKEINHQSNCDKIEVDLTNFQSGIYFISISDNSNIIKTEKLIIIK